MEDQSDVEEESKLEDSFANGNQEVHESTTSTDYSLFDLPPDLGRLRHQLHDLETAIEMPKVDFQAVMPYMDNVWRKLKSSEQTQNAELYWCKLRKPPGAKPHVPRPTPEGKQARKRKRKEEKTCGMAMKVIYDDGLDTVTIMKAVEGERHTHDLDMMDEQKRNSGIMDTSRREAVRGFQPASIFWKMQQEPEKLEAAGGKYCKLSDIRNTQYAWRQENPDAILQAHTGYNSTRAGPKPGQPREPKPKPSPAQTAAQPAALASQSIQPPPQQQLLQQPPPAALVHYAAPLPAQVLYFPMAMRRVLNSYLPDQAMIAAKNRPHVTLTWASSLDGRIASSPGYRTALSGPDTKAMTHFLRSTHDAILIGVRTAIADDPSLNCRLSGAGGFGGPGIKWQPRPIIIDPTGRLVIRPEMNILRVAAMGRAKAPWIIVRPDAKLHTGAVATLKAHGGEYLMINEFDPYGRFGWEGIFQVLYREGIKSIMIEGGGLVLSELLSRRHLSSVDSVIMTIVPTFLGRMGVQVTQETEYDHSRAILQNRLADVTWQPMGSTGDIVMCGRLEQPPAQSNGILQGIVEMANADGSHQGQDRPAASHPSAPAPAPAPYQVPWAGRPQQGPSQGPPQHSAPQQASPHHGPPPPGPPQHSPPQQAPPHHGPLQKGPPQPGPPQYGPPQQRPQEQGSPLQPPPQQHLQHASPQMRSEPQPTSPQKRKR